jgi:trans-aconitate 2-methyltransferase
MAKDSWNPEQYEKFKNQRSLPFFDLMKMVEPRSGARVIDLGCGTGELTAELHKYMGAAESVGMDSSDEMLKKASAFTVEGIRFEIGHIDTWSAKAEYDLVFSNAALQWVGDHTDLFRRLRESLREGGQLAVQMPMNHDHPTHVIATAMSREEPWISKLKGQAYDKFKALKSVEDYASMLFRLGFKEQNVLLKVYPQVMESRDSVVEWVRGSMLTYFEARLTPDDFRRFVAEFKKRLFEVLPDDQPFFYPFKRVLMWAKL